MLGYEVVASVRNFVVLDNDEAGDEGGESSQVEDGVGIGALGLLLRRMGGLENEDGLRYEEDAGGVKELGVG